MKKITNPLFVLFPFIVFSQSWQQYSDSVLVYFKKNDIEKTTQFINLADNELSKINIIKDTIYADYIYRKGVVKSSLDIKNSLLLKESNDILKQSLDIWQISSKKNYLKILKINYYLGCNYYLVAGNDQNKLEYLNSYKYFEQCHNIIRKHNYKSNPLYKRILYFMALIDYHIKKDLNNAKKIANEYIEFTKKQNFEDFNFDNVEIYNFNQDYINQEKLLLNYLDNYNIQKLNDTDLLFKIYLKLHLNKLEFKDQNGDFNFPKEIIKYGEEALKIGNLNKSRYQLEIDKIHRQLELAYIAIKDNNNSEKYRKLNYEYYLKNNELDYYDILESLYNNEEYDNFKIKFDSYENDLISKKDFDELCEIYKFSLTLFERSLLFNIDEVANQLTLISKNRNSLNDESKVDLDLMMAEYYLFTNQIPKSLEICNNNLNIKDVFSKLKFYQFKSACEELLGEKEKAINTANKTLKIAIDTYGENDYRVLPYLISILDLDIIGTDSNSIQTATKALKILYDNKLEQTTGAVSVWIKLATAAKNKFNYKDALIYLEKSKSIIENTKPFNKPFLHYSCLVDLGIIYTIQNNYKNAKEYLDAAKLLLDNNPNFLKVWYEQYYYALGMFYFYQDKFLDAKINYDKSFSFYDSSGISTKKLYSIFCDYFLDNDINKAIDKLEKYQKENNNTFWGSSAIYLLKYNSGDNDGAKNILIRQLIKLISENNQYYQLLSYDEKENLYKSFVNQFEYLNSHLINSDLKFLEKYINFRFYSKTLLFFNSINTNRDDEKNKELYTELKNNTIKINNAIENKSQDLKGIEELKNKNREIEKFLSINIKPLVVPTLKDLNTKLVSGEAYIEIVRINKQSKNGTKKGIDIVKMFTDSISYGAIVIKKNSTPKFILIDGSNQLEKQYAFNLKTKIQSKQEDLESYNLLFEKIDNELKDVKKIYLVTDGIYNSINVESIYNPNRKQYLIDYLKIQLIQNVKAITDEKNEFKVDSTTKAVLFGNPDFDLLITDANTNDFSLDRGLDNNVLDEIKSSVKIGRLNGTQKEIETLNAILKNSKSNVELFSKSTATEDNLKKTQSPDILHIATHGYFLSDNDTSKSKKSIANLFNENYKDDSYLKVGLLFAGAQNSLNAKQPLSKNNGILTAEEVKSLNLKDTDLVVLSACETGLGDNLVGQGVIGLQRAFMIAGAKSVIMSLWSVSDEKTQELMTLFYINLINNNMTKEDALHQAKLAMKKLYPEPYYWAGFILLE
jgi:CHAT domain-containing protein